MPLSQYGKLPAARRIAVLSVVLPLALAGVWAIAIAGQAQAAAPQASSVATLSRTVAFSETARLHKVSKNGASFVERGSATGTYEGSLTLFLTTTPKGVKWRMKGKNRSGSLIGSGAATITSHGKVGSVNGRARFTGGTGKFAGAHGDGLKVTGTFNRETYVLTVTISGGLHF
jgi:hypothetical protein